MEFWRNLGRTDNQFRRKLLQKYQRCDSERRLRQEKYSLCEVYIRQTFEDVNANGQELKTVTTSSVNQMQQFLGTS